MNLTGNVLLWIGLVTLWTPNLANIGQRLLHRPRRFDTTLTGLAGWAVVTPGSVLTHSWWPWTAMFAALAAFSAVKLYRRHRARPQPDDGGFLP